MSPSATRQPDRRTGTPRRHRSIGVSHLRAVGGADRSWHILEGDCLSVLAELRRESVDAVVCDPPYGIDFQSKRWDGRAIRDAAATTSTRRRLTASEAFQEWTRSWAAECLNVLKPGGHLLAFGSPRTFHRLACGLEDAGLELRDTLMWAYGSGMPKSRRLTGGTGTALKPAWEPIVLARKKPGGSIQAAVDEHGTGALNIDACRIGERWPANLLLAHDERCTTDACAAGCAVTALDDADRRDHAAAIAPSRLFFSSKVSRSERDAGCERLPAGELNLFPNAHRAGRVPAAARNPHPTVKPIALMRWLVRLACPPAGLVLDPFCGSGSTGIGARLEGRLFLGIEREAAYVPIARARIAHWTDGESHEEPATHPLGEAGPRRHRRANR
jgi:site-specific DNA-methyltransferase (adenine-specific)